MTDLEPILHRLGLQQYLEVFVEEGFDTWLALTDIQESDLEYLNVKLGHRRKLQRAIAAWRGWAPDRSLGSPTQESTAPEAQNPERQSLEDDSYQEQSGPVVTEQKRKYRRHPKPDPNAPERPPSAYVLFSNVVREDVKWEKLSFTDIARLVGERWQNLSPTQKGMFKSRASALKDSYNAQLMEYRKSDAYKEHGRYLAEFKEKYSGNKEDTKRAKLETDQDAQSLSSSGLTDGLAQSSGHHRGMSLGSRVPAASTHHSNVRETPNYSNQVTHRPLSTHYGSLNRLELASSASSMSESSSSAKLDAGDALSRTASLSLANEPSPNVPSIGLPANRTGWTDLYSGSNYSGPSGRRPAQIYTSSFTHNTSPTSTTPSTIADGKTDEWWRHGNQDRRGSSSLGGSSTVTGITISQLVKPDQREGVQEHATGPRLAPLRHMRETTPPTLYGGPKANMAPDPAQQTRVGLAPIRERPMHENTSRSESEVANVLTNLSKRQGEGDSKQFGRAAFKEQQRRMTGGPPT